MLGIKGKQKKYAEKAQPSSTYFCLEKCLWSLDLDNFCFHEWLLSE